MKPLSVECPKFNMHIKSVLARVNYAHKKAKTYPTPEIFSCILGTFHQKLSIKLLANLNIIFSAVYNRSIYFIDK